MSELNVRKVHDYTVDPATGVVRLTRENHYVALRSGDTPPLYVQNGEIFSSGGPKIDPQDLPEWFWPEARKVSSQMRALVGLWLPEEGQTVEMAEVGSRTLPEPSQALPEVTIEGLDNILPGYWGCTECGDVVELKRKGVHIAKHRREAKVGK